MSQNSYTDYPGGITSMGVPLPNITQGNVWFVEPISGVDSSGSADGQTPATAFKTLAYALSRATANQNDIIYLFSEGNSSAATTDYLSAGLDWNKDLVHLIGVTAQGTIGQRARIAQLSTVKTIEKLFTVSANGCMIENISVYQGVAASTATAPVAVTISGQRNRFKNCQFSGNGDSVGSTDTAGARSLVLDGAAENTFDNCYIGLDTVVRTKQTAEIGLVGACTRNIFSDCIISTYTSTTAFLPVTVAADMDRFTIFKNCMFIAAANVASSALPAAVFGGSIASINGLIHLVSPYTNCSQYAAADAARVLALGYDGTATGHLIGIAQAIDAA